MANLIAAEEDRERLRQMLLALEAKQRLVELLTAYVDGRQQEVRVVVGLDEASPAMQDLVLIGAPARLGGGNLGTVAVIAPTRIQYQEMIQAVRYIARLVGAHLGGSSGVAESKTDFLRRLSRAVDEMAGGTVHDGRMRYCAAELSLKKNNIGNVFGRLRRGMPEQEAELKTLEAAEDVAPEGVSAEGEQETAAASRADFDKLQGRL